MNILYIDTSSNEQISVSLKMHKESYLLSKRYGKKRAQIVLPLITELLQKHSLRLDDLDKIEVNIGPGSFTGVRVGVSIANTLGFFLHIPINNQPPGKLVEARYT